MKIINKLPKEVGKFKEIEIECSEYDSLKEDCKSLEIPESFSHEECIDWIKKNVKKNSSILELASGAFPRVGIELHKDYEVYLSDISEGLMKRAKEKLESKKIKDVNLYVIDAENLPFEDNSFDVVLINASFHHLPDYKKGAKEMSRVLKKKGYLIIAFEPNRWHLVTIRNFIRLTKKLFGIKKANKNFSIADFETEGFTKKNFKDIAKENSLKIISLRRLQFFQGFYSFFMNYFLKFKGDERVTYKHKIDFTELDNLLLKIPLLNILSWQWTVIYQK